MIIEISEDNFEQSLHQHPLIFMDFWGEWCAPCKDFSAIFLKIAAEFPDVSFATVDVAKNPQLAEAFEIRSIPHLLVFKEAIAIYSESGSMSEQVLRDLVLQALKADVSGIKDKLEDDGV
jgi:thioredoxin 1